MLVSGYQSIEMQRIVLPVKFDGGLFISVLRNEQHFTKKWGSKPISFQKLKFPNLSNPTNWKKDRPWKKFHFSWISFFERDRQPNFSFDTDSEVLFIYRLIPRKLNFPWLAC
jgi:hypothetical protein